MTKIVFSAEARRDLMEAADYIAFKLQNRSAARRLVERIQKAVLSLGAFPESGTPLDILKSRTAYRYLICGNYMIFYDLADDTVRIDRILYGRRDYLSILFGEELSEEQE